MQACIGGLAVLSHHHSGSGAVHLFALHLCVLHAPRHTMHVTLALFWVQRSMEANFEYYFRCYALCFQVGLKLATQCEGLRHIVGISAPGCNLSQSPRLSYDDKGQARMLSVPEGPPTYPAQSLIQRAYCECSTMHGSLAGKHNC